LVELPAPAARQVLLVALEAAPGGLRAAARHSADLAAALVRLLERAAAPPPCALGQDLGLGPGAAAAAAVSPETPRGGSPADAGSAAGAACGAAAAAVCAALRGLEALAAHDAALPLPAAAVAGALHCPALLFAGGGAAWRGGSTCAGPGPRGACRGGGDASGAAGFGLGAVGQMGA